MPPRVLRAQERPLPTLNAVLMPATTALLPRLSLQRRTRSRNRFSSFVLRLSACLHARPLVPFYAPLCLSRASRRTVPLLFQSPRIYLFIEDRLWGCTTWIGSIVDRFYRFYSFYWVPVDFVGTDRWPIDDAKFEEGGDGAESKYEILISRIYRVSRDARMINWLD